MSDSLKRTRSSKIVVVGNFATGKTSLIVRMVQGTFSNIYRATIGLDFFSKIVRLADHTCLELQLWDMAGQDRDSFMKLYSRKSALVVIAYDVIADPQGRSLHEWKHKVVNELRYENEDLPYLIVATKCDLVTDEYFPQFELIKERFPDCAGFLMTSSKQNLNVDELIAQMTLLVSKTQIEPAAATNNGQAVSGLNVVDAKKSQKKKPGCLASLLNMFN